MQQTIKQKLYNKILIKKFDKLEDLEIKSKICLAK
jgi:hypothetical protein